MIEDPLLKANDDAITRVRTEISSAVEALQRAVESVDRARGMVDDILTNRLPELRRDDDT